MNEIYLSDIKLKTNNNDNLYDKNKFKTSYGNLKFENNLINFNIGFNNKQN